MVAPSIEPLRCLQDSTSFEGFQPWRELACDDFCQLAWLFRRYPWHVQWDLEVWSYDCWCIGALPQRVRMSNHKSSQMGGNLKLKPGTYKKTIRLMCVMVERNWVKFETIWGGIQASHLHLHPKTWWVARRCLGRHWSCHQSWQDGEGGAMGAWGMLMGLGNHWRIPWWSLFEHRCKQFSRATQESCVCSPSFRLSPSAFREWKFS